jgi:hypothetical protein
MKNNIPKEINNLMKIFLFISITILIFISSGCDKINKTNTNSQSSDRALTGDQLMEQIGSQSSLNKSNGDRMVTGDELMKSIGILPATESKRRPPRNWVLISSKKIDDKIVESYYDPATVILSYDKRTIDVWFLDLILPDSTTQKIRLRLDCAAYKHDIYEIFYYPDETASGRPIKHRDDGWFGHPFNEGGDFEAVCKRHRY